ncbi:MAG TPA: heparinase II/III family protein [Oscillospiraceae bacterium]|nr:heparinase II/III family protein [Oscillospiraceae bacterium]HPF55778.1 heparinase II/III family protein [Clostridiales bacterium]HPK35849.1 heparinase II/III family protein [Oscillospiraceae bacterium]HPR76014.1 heparinase II/III family protein [Oscillospiraceae bacterium]
MRFFDDVKYRVLPFQEVKIFSDIQKNPGDIPEWMHQTYIKRAEELTSDVIPVLPASIYCDYYNNGNRTRYQDLSAQRRNRLANLAMAEYIEKKGRFLNEIIDLIWATCEETTWVMPAHNVSKDFSFRTKPLLDQFGDDIVFVDLGSVAIASALSWVWHLLGDRIEKEIPDIIHDRLMFELNRRIIKPYLKYEMRWITHFVNNWDPYIVSHMLTITALMVKDQPTREALVRRSMDFLDIFTETYHDDGGCDEGPGYWGMAGASWFDSLELLYDLTGGDIDFFDNDFCRRVGEYLMHVSVDGKYFVNFADASVKIKANYAFIHHFGSRVHSQALQDFAAKYIDNRLLLGSPTSLTYRNIRTLVSGDIAQKNDYTPPKTHYFDGLQVAVMRGDTVYTAIKGGHNDESHNHNDIGNFVVYFENKPWMIDAGVDTYTAATFDPKRRYGHWFMQSGWHNVPQIGGHSQHQGREYKADSFSFDDNTMTAKVSYAGAYEAGTDVKTCTREFGLHGNKITIRDHIACSEPNEVCWVFMVPDKPEIIENGFALDGHKLTVNCPAGISIEAAPALGDGLLSNSWEREYLYRVKITPEKKAEYSVSFEIE